MGEVDYQLALLLQHQFEQEFKRSKDCNSDLELAKSLQEQFQKEYDVEKPIQSLVYDKKQQNNSKSLTDPSWEVVDPTPDIHVLFIAFNERFFWNKLLAVCVSWSKRMTSCAGICSYQWRGGLCSITLSEPLLKLRPRKDLVETLLHEMIHAYLFVTHNNRDRDGHGPEFHKHMYRINAAAGTKITVYHDFHDEVRLYQQHWWRCDGPCQKWKPFFGMVRRAMNRAPGPHDRWWGDHSRSCGGNFIKVKEPEKPKKKPTQSQWSKENKKPKEDIRKFLPPSSATSSSKTSSNNKTPNNIHGLANTNNNSKPTTVISSNSSNIFGFTNLNGTANTGSSKGKGIIRGAVRNNSSTIVINKTQCSPTKPNSTKSGAVSKPDSSVTSKSDTTLTDKPKTGDNFDYSAVRNHWLNKYENGSTSNGIKRELPAESNSSPSKIPKLTVPGTSSSSSTSSEKEEAQLVECPVCKKSVQLSRLNRHLDECLQSSKDTKECVICEKNVRIREYEKHTSKCAGDVFEIPEEDDFIKCTFCEENVPTKDYSNHISRCLRDLDSRAPKHIIDLTCDNTEEKRCAICEKNVPAADYDMHAEKCLIKMCSEMESTYSNKEESVDCLACGKTIIKSELGLHLEDCMSMSGVFDDTNEPKEGETPDDPKSEDDKYNCPFCMELVSEAEMSSHIDICLNIKDSLS